MSNSSDIGGAPPTVQRGRKRVKDPSKLVKNVAKIKNDSGVEYISRKTGKLIPAHVIGTLCNDGCFERVTEPDIRNFHKQFWEIGNYDKQCIHPEIKEQGACQVSQAK